MMTTDHLSASAAPPPRRPRRSPLASVAHAVAAVALYSMYFVFLIVSVAMAAVIWPTCELWRWAADRWEDWRSAPAGGWGFDDCDLGGRD